MKTYWAARPGGVFLSAEGFNAQFARGCQAQLPPGDHRDTAQWRQLHPAEADAGTIDAPLSAGSQSKGVCACGCGRNVEGARRSTKRYASDSCRKRVFRRRKDPLVGSLEREQNQHLHFELNRIHCDLRAGRNPLILVDPTTGKDVPAEWPKNWPRVRKAARIKFSRPPVGAGRDEKGWYLGCAGVSSQRVRERLTEAAREFDRERHLRTFASEPNWVPTDRCVNCPSCGALTYARGHDCEAFLAERARVGELCDRSKIKWDLPPAARAPRATTLRPKRTRCPACGVSNPTGRRCEHCRRPRQEIEVLVLQEAA